MTLSRGRERLLLGLLVAAFALADTWRLSINGWGNAYYAGIAQTGSWSWVSGFFASLDIGNVTSTDKPPLALWPMMISAGIFGTHPVPVLAPQAVLSVVTLLILVRTVRRVAGPAASLLAGAIYAVTPVVVALARYDDPDVMLVLWAVVAAWLTVRIAERETARLVFTLGAVLGLGFMSKWVMGLIIAPAILAALWPSLRAAGVRHAARLTGLIGAGFAATGLPWLIVLAVLGPERRPFADASGGSLVGLVLGSEAVGRLSGNGGGTISGVPGVGRLLSAPFADQIGWLIPAAAILLGWFAVTSWRDRSTPATPEEHKQQLGIRLFGAWLVTDLILFSAMGGAMHPYYTVHLAPALAGVIAIAGRAAVHARARRVLWATGIGSVAYGGWVAWQSQLLTPNAVVVAMAVLAAGALVWGVVRLPGRPLTVLVSIGLAVAFVGPVATCMVTLGTSVSGPDPRAGTSVSHDSWRLSQTHAVVDFVRHLPTAGTWAIAVPQATPAADLQLASGRPVLALGGFTGSTDSPRISQMKAFVASGKLRYVALIGQWSRHLDDTPASMRNRPLGQVMQWAQHTGCPLSIGGGITVLDLTDHRCHDAPESP